jgi:transcriptional regulator with XRE-family HTH domain
MSHDTLQAWLTMEFPERLVALRKQRLFTQQALADTAAISTSILKRYEAGRAQPTLPVLRNLAVALGVSADVLLFDKDERGPIDEILRLQFEAVSRLPKEEKRIIQALLDGMIVKHRTKQLVGEIRS